MKVIDKGYLNIELYREVLSIDEIWTIKRRISTVYFLRYFNLVMDLIP